MDPEKEGIQRVFSDIVRAVDGLGLFLAKTNPEKFSFIKNKDKELTKKKIYFLKN